jgi:flagellar hook protein FlgE
MVGALWTGISGLGGSQTGLDNESNNIANVNTIGFKASRVSFADQMYQDKIGKGVTSFDVEKMYTQGNLKNTGVSYDMALSGDGFFQVKNGADTYYTRAGNFRMGEGGALEDVAQNKVQGWAIQPITDKDRTATDPNAQFFTNDFTKLLGNKVIRDTTSIETIVAKATDYTTTAKTDDSTVFSGAGYKSASTKISDVEALITEYNSALSVYAEADPKPTSSTSSSQKSLLNFPLTGSELAEGDEIYAYIDGVKYSVPFDTDNATTMKNFADKLSDAGGFTSYLTGDTTSPFDPDTQTAPEMGYLVVEGLIPGKQFRVTEFGWTDADNNNQASKGDEVTISPAVLGTGMGHINSIRDAMAEAVSGKQMDVFGNSEIALNTANTVPDIASNKYTYQITIYDNDLGKDVTVPATPLVLDGARTNAVLPATYATTGYDATTPALKDAAITEMVNKINLDPELSKYVEATNFNGNLVVKTKDKNYDVEFTSELKATEPVQEVQTVTLNGGLTGVTATEEFTFLGHTVTGLDNSGGAAALYDTAEEVAAYIGTNSGTSADGDGVSFIGTWNAANPTRKIDTITADVAPNANRLIITYMNTEGNVSPLLPSTDNGVSFGESLETQPGRATGILPKNPNLSGREGAGAEFLQINTNINQTASKSDLQLRLDTLGLTDSAFGDFEVDGTGLVTMTQDGARFAIGQVSIARFTDNRGLEPVGDNLLMETTRSGSALFNINNDKTAEIKGGTLELSTADLSESLVNLMVFQRAFEANAKSITTADTILTTLIGLKR